MKIGIGISTTSNRKEHLKLCVSQIEKHTKDYVLHIAKDVSTIAKAKNECLHVLKDCDYIFLFDDDCFPIKDRWVEFFTEISKDWDGVDHLLYLTQRHNQFDEICESPGCIEYYRECGGCFMFLTKDCLERVGYFNTEYKQYGFEHAGWSYRALDLKLTRNNPKGMIEGYQMLRGTKQYIYSLDYQGEGNWGVKHQSSITDYKAQAESIEYNRQVFLKEINSDKIYYEYEK